MRKAKRILAALMSAVMTASMTSFMTASAIVDTKNEGEVAKLLEGYTRIEDPIAIEWQGYQIEKGSEYYIDNYGNIRILSPCLPNSVVIETTIDMDEDAFYKIVEAVCPDAKTVVANASLETPDIKTFEIRDYNITLEQAKEIYSELGDKAKNFRYTGGMYQVGVPQYNLSQHKYLRELYGDAANRMDFTLYKGLENEEKLQNFIDENDIPCHITVIEGMDAVDVVPDEDISYVDEIAIAAKICHALGLKSGFGVMAASSVSMPQTVYSESSVSTTDNTSTEETTESTNFKAMTLDDAMKDIAGNYVWITGEEPEIIPMYNVTYYGRLAVDENNKLRNIQIRKAATVIKVKSGKELPYDDIKAAVEAEGKVMPVIKKNGSDYEIINASSEENYYYTLELIKNCPDVTSVEVQYIIFEDTANSVMFGGWQYNGDLSPEELTEKYPELTADISPATDEIFYIYNGDRSNLYDFVCRVVENGDHFSGASYAGTELAIGNPKYYYCNKPVLIDGTDGDANIDGYVDVSDSVMIMQSIANPDKYGIRAENGITAQGTYNADTDDNGLTNSDALEIQKSLLGMGSIPIPPKDSKVDIVSYDHIDFTEEYDYRTVTLDDKDFRNTGVTVGIGKIGEEIGEFNTVSIENGDCPANIYRIKNVSSDFAIAVKLNGSNNYFVYRYIWYRPETIGQLIDDLDLENNLVFTKVYFTTHNPKYKMTDYEPEKALIWNTLFSDRSIEVSKHEITNTPEDKKVKIDVACDTPMFGRFNFGINVYGNGYVSTNLVESGAEFCISAEKAQELIDYYSR